MVKEQLQAFGLNFADLAQGKFAVPALVTMLLILLTTALFCLWRYISSKADTVLLVGLNNCGKTLMFARLVNSTNVWHTFSSTKQNLFTDYYSKNGTHYKVVDYPGAESLRKSLFLKWLAKGKQNIRIIIFVIDSTTFNAQAKDVAEFLYDVFYESKKSIPVLVACNKQDIAQAKSSNSIHEVLQREFGLINVSREAALSSTTGESTKRLISTHGAEFQMAELTRAVRVEFVECSAEEDDNFNLSPVRDWIDSL